MLHWFNFSKLVFFVNTSFYVQYSNASNSHISQYQGPILLVCGAQPIKTDRDVTLPRSSYQRKTTKKDWKIIRPFNWFSDPSFKIVLFHLAWLSWVFHASLVSRFVFWCGNSGCADATPHTCLQYAHHFELRH